MKNNHEIYQLKHLNEVSLTIEKDNQPILKKLKLLGI